MEKLLWLKNSIGLLARRVARAFWYTVSFLPDEEKLWRSVYLPRDQLKKTGEVKRAFFRDKTGLSCDIARFSTAERSRRGHADPLAWPAESGLLEFSVASVRKVGSDVCHVPVRNPPTNYAHCEFSVWLTTDQAEDLVELAEMCIPHSFPGYGSGKSRQLREKKVDG